MNRGTFQWRIQDHAGDLRLELRAQRSEGLFQAATAALLEVLTDPDLVIADQDLELNLRSDDPESLLVAWLNELLFLFETRSLLVTHVDIQLLDAGRRLEAQLRAVAYDATLHPIKTAVKAATHHRLKR